MPPESGPAPQASGQRAELAPPPLESQREARARRLALWIALAVAAWAWSFLPSLGFTGEDLALLDQQRSGFERSGHVFRPLWDLWFWLGQRCFGAESARPYHLGSLALHLVNAGLVYALARALRWSGAASVAAAALFALGAGCGDSLCWIAASNRLLSGCGALIALNGIARLWCAPRAALALLGAGLLFQLGSNEEVYGTALLASAALLARGLSAPRGAGAASAPAAAREPTRAPRGRALWFAAALAPLALLLAHYVWLRGSAGARLVEPGALAQTLAAVPAHAFERWRALADGWLPAPLALACIALAWFAGALRAQRPAALLLIAWTLASCIPFALEGGSRYRDYPSQAPLALSLALGIELAIGARAGRAPGRALWAYGWIALLLPIGMPQRNALEQAWRAATRELAECTEPLRALQRELPGRAPLLVNLESSTRQWIVHAYGLPSVEAVGALAFLDHASGYVPSAELAQALAGSAPLFGRRADGSIGRLARADFESRPVLAPLARLQRALCVPDRASALSRLATGADDLAALALVEAPREALASLPGEGGALAFEWIEPIAIDRARLEARGSIRIEGERSSLLAIREPWLWSDALRFPPDYAHLGRVLDPRVVRLAARLDGAQALPVWPADGSGFAVLAPAGAHTVQLLFSLAPALPVGD